MSRYVENGVAFGWDDPLEVYFAQTFNEDQEVVIDIEAKNIINFQSLIAKNGITISDRGLEMVYRDRAGSRGPTPLQRKMRDMFPDEL
jgi:hypothetical protein